LRLASRTHANIAYRLRQSGRLRRNPRGGVSGLHHYGNTPRIGSSTQRLATETQAYRPKDYRIHDFFNVSRLEPYKPRDKNLPPLPSAIYTDNEPLWEAAEALATCKREGRVEHRVRWKGWGREYDELVWEAA